MKASVRWPWLLILATTSLACADEASRPQRVINLATAAPATATAAPALVDPATGDDVAAPPATGDDTKTPPAGDGATDGQAEDATLRVRGGELSPEVIQQTLASAAPALQRCTAAARSKRPDLRGSLVLAFKVKPTGLVAWAKAAPASTVRDPALERCAVALVKRQRFGKFKGGAAFVTYPIALE